MLKSGEKPPRPERARRRALADKSGNPPTSTGRAAGSGDAIVDQTNWRRQLRTATLKFDDVAKAVFLQEYARHGLKGRSARAAGVTIDTVNNHVKNDEEFAKQIIEAFSHYHDKVIHHHQSLVLDGVVRRRFTNRGELVEETVEYPIPLILAEIKRVDPEYRDKQTIDLNMGGGVMVAPHEMTPEQWIAEQEKLNIEQRKGPDDAIDVTNAKEDVK